MQYNGFYIGTVVDNDDSKDKENGYLGRIKVSIPNITGNIPTNDLPWAEPCFPYASSDKGIFFIPEIGSKVTVYFIEGSPKKPVWIGCIYREVDKVRMPVSGVMNYPNRKIIKTDTGQLLFDDTDSYIELKHKNGSVLWIDNKGNIGFQNDKNHYISINNMDNSLKMKHADGSMISIDQSKTVIAHKSGSSITMDGDGNIEIHSAGDMNLISDGQMTLHSASHLNLLSDSHIYETSNGGNINLNPTSGKYGKGNVEAVKPTTPVKVNTTVNY